MSPTSLHRSLITKVTVEVDDAMLSVSCVLIKGLPC